MAGAPEASPAPAPEALCAAYEQEVARARGRAHRKAAGVFYTPPEVAAAVVRLALEHGPALPARPLLLDPCAGAGIFLLAAARALPQARLAGADLDPEALAVAGRALRALRGGPGPRLEALDALRRDPACGPADLVVGNPPYGHAAAGERGFLGERFPALRGGEIDLYAAFLLRSLELVRPGGCAALLIPDTWMTNARGARLREAVLERARLRAVADLGKPFADAKDTRVQAIVLERRSDQPCSWSREPGAEGAKASSRTSAPAYAARLEGGALRPLAPLQEADLRARAKAGWQPYRTPGEKRLCAALEAAAVPLASICEVGYGLRTGDNRRHVSAGAGPEGAIALCGGEDVVPFALRWRRKHLAAPGPELERLAHRQLGRPRVAVQRIRTNAAAPWARWLEAAPVPATVAGLDSLSTLAAPDPELLWALLALCGSVAWNRWHRLRTTDVNVKPAALRELPAPRALASAEARAPLLALARLRAHEVAAELARRSAGRSAGAGPAPATERAIDRAVYELFGLAGREVEEAERGFWGDRFAEEFQRLPTAAGARAAAGGVLASPAMSDPFARVAAFREA